MVSQLESIRKKLLEKELGKTNNKNYTPGESPVYPFTTGKAGNNLTFRLLPDGDENNGYVFWVEKYITTLTFPGVKGGDEHKEVSVQVPCMEMYGEKKKDPILQEISGWWKKPGGNGGDDETHALASKYYRKVTYICQGFVVNSPIQEQNTPKNPIRRFHFFDNIHKVIRNSIIESEDTDPLVTDYVNGRDLKLSIGQKGQYKDYSASFSMKTRALTEDELEAISEYGLPKLTDLIPPKPTDEELDIILSMFHDSLNNELYDPEKYAKFYKPWNLDTKNSGGNSTGGTTASVVAKVKETVTQVEEDEDDEPARVVPNTATNDALARLKANVKQAEVAEEEDEEVSQPSKPASGGSGQDAKAILDRIKSRSKN